MSEPINKITTPCPCCGAKSIFVASGGHLTCSVIGCKEPSVEAFIMDIKDRLARAYSDWQRSFKDIEEFVFALRVEATNARAKAFDDKALQ